MPKIQREMYAEFVGQNVELHSKDGYKLLILSSEDDTIKVVTITIPEQEQVEDPSLRPFDPSTISWRGKLLSQLSPEQARRLAGWALHYAAQLERLLEEERAGGFHRPQEEVKSEGKK